MKPRYDDVYFKGTATLDAEASGRMPVCVACAYPFLEMSPFSEMTAEARAEWIADCLKWRGLVLVGKFSHWCSDWDGLVVDETCGGEWEACGCFDEDHK